MNQTIQSPKATKGPEYPLRAKTVRGMVARAPPITNISREVSRRLFMSSLPQILAYPLWTTLSDYQRARLDFLPVRRLTRPSHSA